MKFEFRPLPHAEWINNCEIIINNHFAVSVMIQQAQLQLEYLVI